MTQVHKLKGDTIQTIIIRIIIKLWLNDYYAKNQEALEETKIIHQKVKHGRSNSKSNSESSKLDLSIA